ncbi:hypothetical protein CBF27_07210 [Vagococcus acidifermentans]|uniref:HTH-like domain-containing protein n=1 Tax=Vagococcus acidifermentans TaxID=564710 RepID=A0A430AUK6_9ENTE|nr:hypothetical protein CBF27_07210 [Vagococcus acidifermentans]
MKFILWKDYQLRVSRRRITRLLHKQGLYTRGARRKYRRQMQQTPHVHKNLINQAFNITEKNNVWYGDITYCVLQDFSTQ